MVFWSMLNWLIGSSLLSLSWISFKWLVLVLTSCCWLYFYLVLFFVEPMDEVAIQNLKSYKEKNFFYISKEDLDLCDKNEEKEKGIQQEFSKKCDWVKKRLGDKIACVDISYCLGFSPCVLVSDKFGSSANMERLMTAQTMGDPGSMEFMRSRRVLEINPQHPILIKSLNVACEVSPEEPEALNSVDLLFEMALISSGFTSDYPRELSSKIL